ncbi:MAG: hypothetical protein H6738_12475 [Alphaproteobacteria bacterium]|nr:hypothetical protein [Alphaproteobacteria bacterium]
MSSDNPFDSGFGGADDGMGANEEGTLDAVDLDVVPILERSWQLVTADPGIVIAALVFQIIPSGIVGGIQGGLQVAMDGNPDDGTMLVLQLLYFGAQILNLLIGVFVSLGLARVFTRMSRGLPAEVGMLFGEGRRYFQGLASTMLMGFVVGLGFLLFFVPGVILGVGLQFFIYALVDQDLGAVDALKESWRLTDGYKFTVFLTNFAIGLIGLAIACVTCGIGYLAFLPVLSLTQAVMYHSLVHLQGTAASPRNADSLV